MSVPSYLPWDSAAFVGGPLDGRTHAVPPDSARVVARYIRRGGQPARWMVVRDDADPSELFGHHCYRLGEDGRFRYEGVWPVRVVE